MNQQVEFDLKLKASHLIDIWREFCEKHTALYDFTCEEYIHLLASDIDKLNETLVEKKELLNFINSLDEIRSQTTDEIMSLLGQNEAPKKLNVLLATLKENNEVAVADQIEKLNLILLDIIEKIQAQNKKNQIFLNKAIHSLKELKDSFGGKTSKYKTYSAKGIANKSVRP